MNIGKETLEAITTISKEYGATKMVLFGSALENPETASVTGWKLFELAAHLENVLHINLDLIPLNPPSRLTRYIEASGKRLI